MHDHATVIIFESNFGYKNYPSNEPEVFNTTNK